MCVNEQAMYLESTPLVSNGPFTKNRSSDVKARMEKLYPLDSQPPVNRASSIRPRVAPISGDAFACCYPSTDLEAWSLFSPENGALGSGSQPLLHSHVPGEGVEFSAAGSLTHRTSPATVNFEESVLRVLVILACLWIV